MFMRLDKCQFVKLVAFYTAFSIFKPLNFVIFVASIEIFRNEEHSELLYYCTY